MERISVAIRVRPLSKQEDARASPWKLGPTSITFCHASSLSPPAFTFDQVFAPDIPTSEIYQESAKHLITSAVQGFNGTIFAYGQTSSGKTYTMRGSPEEPGIIPQALRDVFLLIDLARDREFLIRVSYMEIYNEEINDLLAPENQKLQVHENLERGIFVAGLREEIVSTPDQVLELLAFGEAHRRVGETNMNVYSSRSHTIFRMVIESRDVQDSTSSGACDAVRVSVLNLVDLAGSERVSKTGAEGARLKEGTHINKSLMTLGNVINKLSEGIHKQGGHVPYRDSKLTRILQPALGGNAKTTIICNITPALIHADETKGTLQFASRANRVTNCAQVNEVMTDAALLKRQKKEIEDLRSKLQESNSEHLEDEILSLRNKLLKFELEKERLALELLEEKKRIKEQEQKIEKLGTMVINSAIDDRDYAKKGSRRERRETWCPRVPSSNPTLKTHDFERSFQKVMSPDDFIHSTKRMQPMPPPFEMLLEHDEEGVEWNSQEFVEDISDYREPNLAAVGESFLLDPDAFPVQRKRRSLPTRIDEAEAQQEIVDLRLRYQQLQSEHDVKMSQIMIENKDLKEKLVQLTASTDGKPDPLPSLQDRRCKSLDGGDVDESGSVIKNLHAQVGRLETEKFYMQRELDRLMEQAKGQTTTAQEDLKELYQELKETTEQLNMVEEQNKKLQDELCKLKLPAMSNQERGHTKSSSELERVKSGSMGEADYGEVIQYSVVEKHDVGCQTLSLLSGDEDNICSNLLDGDKCCCRPCADSVCKKLIPEHVKALCVEAYPSETERAVNSLDRPVNDVTCISDLPAELLKVRVSEEGSRSMNLEDCSLKSVECTYPGEAHVHVDHGIVTHVCADTNGTDHQGISMASGMVHRSHDAATSLESCPGLLETPDQQNRGAAPHLSQGISDMLVELETLRDDNIKLSSELEEALRNLDLANVDLCTCKHRLIDIEQMMVEKEKQCTVFCETIQDLEQQKVHRESELSQLRSDILALRKELASLKMSPPLLEKERDALRKELDMHKTKAKEVQAKLKSALQDKSRLEADKANVERELKHLRGSTMLQRDINRRDSIADKRRESMAPALNKTKQQLSSLEHALQMRSTELERAAFDIQVLQESCSKLEFSVTESENLGSTLKEQLTTAEAVIENLKQENKIKDENSERLAIELEAASEQWKASILDKEELQQQCAALAAKLQEHEISAIELMKEKQDLSQQLIDAYSEFEEEKAAWARRLKDHCERVSADALEQMTVLGRRVDSFADALEKTVRTQEEFVTVSKEVDNELQTLQYALQDVALLQTDELEGLSAQLDSMQTRYTAYEKEVAQVKAELRVEHGARMAQSNQMQLWASALQKYMDIISGLERRCTELATDVCEKLDHVTGEHEATIDFLSLKLLESGQLNDLLAEHLYEVDQMHKKADQEEKSHLVPQLSKVEATMKSTEGAPSASPSVLSNSNLDQTARWLAGAQDLLEQQPINVARVEVDVGAQNKILKEKNRQLSISNMKLQIGIQSILEREEVYRGRLQEALWARDENDRSGQMDLSRTGMSHSTDEQHTLEYRKLQEDIAASRLEIVELKVELENARGQCAALIQNSVQNSEQDTRILEIEHENYTLQHRLQIAEERSKTRRDIIRKLRDEVKARESSSEQAAMEELMFQKAKLEEQVRELTTELNFLHNQVKSTHLQYSLIQGTSTETAAPTVDTIVMNLQRTDELRREGLKVVSSGRKPLTPIVQNIMHDGRLLGSHSKSTLKARGLRRPEFTGTETRTCTEFGITNQM